MIEKTKLAALYQRQRLSMTEAAEALNTSHATVLYWLKKHHIARRSWSESAYEKHNKNGDPFIIPRYYSARQRELLLVGILLYWAEGNKGQSAIRLANLDPRMLQLFLKFLRELFQINEQRLYLYVRVHKQFPLTEAKKYWASLLRMQPQHVLVYQHTDQRSHAHKQWSRYGIATLQFHNAKLKRWLDSAIENYLRRELGRNGEGVNGLLTQKKAVLNGRRAS